MKNEKIYDGITGIREEIVLRAENYKFHKSSHRNSWMKWGAMAACLCLIVSFSAIISYRAKPEMPLRGEESSTPGNALPPHIGVDGKTYIISSYLAMSKECPEGFVYAGKSAVGGMEDCSYYINPEIPEWVYVYQEVSTDGTVDETGTLNRTEIHCEYVRYVDESIWGKDFVCYNGQLYISLWSASISGESPDVERELYDEIENTYGVRIKADSQEGFVSVGIAEFSGRDTVPKGKLSCNTDSVEVLVNPTDERVLLIPTEWYTAPQGENGETKHSGYNVYVRME